jgi:hypothetical protein
MFSVLTYGRVFTESEEEPIRALVSLLLSAVDNAFYKAADRKRFGRENEEARPIKEGKDDSEDSQDTRVLFQLLESRPDQVL